jgi:hypothetical protein
MSVESLAVVEAHNVSLAVSKELLDLQGGRLDPVIVLRIDLAIAPRPGENINVDFPDAAHMDSG